MSGTETDLTSERQTYHQTCARADHEHWAVIVETTLLVKALMEGTTEENVGDTQTEASNDEIEHCAVEWSARLLYTLDRIARQRLVRPEIKLSPLRCMQGQLNHHMSVIATHRHEGVHGR